MKALELHGRILFEVIWSGNEPEWLGTSLLTSFFATAVDEVLFAAIEGSIKRSTIREAVGCISAIPSQQFSIRPQTLSSTLVPDHDIGLIGRFPSKTLNMTVMSFGKS
jgi:hypothetical protein